MATCFRHVYDSSFPGSKLWRARFDVLIFCKKKNPRQHRAHRRTKMKPYRHVNCFPENSGNPKVIRRLLRRVPVNREREREREPRTLSAVSSLFICSSHLLIFIVQAFAQQLLLKFYLVSSLLEKMAVKRQNLDGDSKICSETSDLSRPNFVCHVQPNNRRVHQMSRQHTRKVDDFGIFYAT